MTIEIKIEAVAKELKKTHSDKTYTSVKAGEDWINLMGDHRDKKGQTITISDPSDFKGTKWAYVQDKKKETPPPSEPGDPGPADPVYEPIHEGQKTIAQYITVMNRFYQAIKPLEPTDSQALAALINTAMIAWVNGKIQ